MPFLIYEAGPEQEALKWFGAEQEEGGEVVRLPSSVARGGPCGSRNKLLRAGNPCNLGIHGDSRRIYVCAPPCLECREATWGP